MNLPEIAWLIERADPRHDGCVLAGHYLGISGYFDGARGGGTLIWMGEVRAALRFCRREDAAKFIGAMELLFDTLPHASTLAGLRRGDPSAIAVEHSWS